MIRLVLLRFLESYFRHRWLYLVPILLMAVFAGFNYLRVKPIYISRGAMYVNRNTLLATLTAATSDGSLWVTPADQTVAEFKQLMQSDAFVRAIIQNTDLEANVQKGPTVLESTFVTVRTVVWAQSLGNNLVLFGATHEQAKLAQQLATSSITTYQQWHISSDQQGSQSAVQFFADQIKKYQDDLVKASDALKSYLEQNPDPVRGDRPSSEKMEIAQLQSVIDLAQKQLINALDKEENARLNMSSAESNIKQQYTVVDAPNLPDSPENSKKQAAINSVIYIAVGVVLGIVGVVGGALIDGVFRFPIDVRHGLDLPVLASIPDLSPQKSGKKKK